MVGHSSTALSIGPEYQTGTTDIPAGTATPVYDPLTRTWFIEGLDFEARSLRELATLCHPLHLNGWCPSGVTIKHKGSVSTRQAFRITAGKTKIRSQLERVALEREKPIDLPSLKEARKATVDIKQLERAANTNTEIVTFINGKENSHHKPRYDRNLILNVWYELRNSVLVAERVNCGEQTVRDVIKKARALSDPRAVQAKIIRTANGPRVASLSTVVWTPERIERLRHLARIGYSSSQIAVDLGGITRNAVIGTCHRKGIRLHGR